MNIGQLLRSVIGDMQVSDAKTLELKVGQVVRGVVLQMLSEQDALMNIGGAQVRAHLEAPLAKGQSALLQVQPESMAGQVVLKPMEVSQVQIPEPSLAELLKSFDMKDTAGNRRALQELHQAKVPLTRENVQGYVDMAARRPEGAADGEWRQSALLAMKRGLPLTQETVGSLHRTIFGGGVSRTIESLSAQLAGFVGNDTPDAAVSPATRNLMAQVKLALEALPGMPQTADADGAASAAEPRAAGEAAQAARPEAAGARPAPAGEAAAQPKAAPPAAEQAATAARPGGADAAAGPVPPPRGEAAAAGAHSARAAAGGQTTGGEGEAPAAITRQEPAPWVGRLLKALGVQHELQLARPHEGGAQALPPHARAGEAAAPPAGSTPPPAADDAAADTATLKGLLLQLSGAEDAPPAVREQAQQLVQQVTGQQLLLTPDRTAMFTHMTLMLPILNQNGSQTAAVHIQSRKGANGQLDARNCHLVFDLDMRTLGTTLVDVQVTDRIVALRVHNDFPEIGTLLEEHREEIREGLEKIGYQLLSVKVLPYPEPLAGGAALGADGVSGDGNSAASASWAASRYHTAPYKGVDVRI
ncbi:hypothetical protein [Paenibacillus sp. YN15]|uniref:hypothetical protein n=1 Tax=Paenibacillus sp. YN15 TaxID=1742774 RepID=UPI000DCB1149|nr:hypothetical protein [Paenibacillus sp. YN15]RAV03448.1 hypothetical protein DQG13_07000 [Paenibacillus sp. YN15]